MKLNTEWHAVHAPCARRSQAHPLQKSRQVPRELLGEGQRAQKSCALLLLNCEGTVCVSVCECVCIYVCVNCVCVNCMCVCARVESHIIKSKVILRSHYKLASAQGYAWCATKQLIAWQLAMRYFGTCKADHLPNDLSDDQPGFD